MSDLHDRDARPHLSVTDPGQRMVQGKLNRQGRRDLSPEPPQLVGVREHGVAHALRGGPHHRLLGVGVMAIDRESGLVEAVHPDRV